MADPTAAALPKPTLEVSTAITATDHGRIVVLAAWLCLTIGVLLSVVRAFIRWPLNILAGKDDTAYAVAMLFAVIQTAMTLNAVDKGLGKVEADLEEDQVDNVAKAIYATDIIFLLSIWTGKLSMSLLFARLAKESNKVRIGWALIVLVSIFSIASIFSNALRDNIPQPWTHQAGTTSGVFARWVASGVMSIVADLVITAMSVYLVWDLQMGSKTKSLVIIAFAVRHFVVPVTIIRLVSFDSVRPEDLSFTYAVPEAMTQLEMYSNLIAVTLPCLRPFLTVWNTSFMDIGLEEIDNNAYKQHVTSYSGTLRKGSAPGSRPGSSSKGHLSRSALWAPSSGRSKTLVETGPREGDSDAASENSESAIVVKTTVDVTNDNRR